MKFTKLIILVLLIILTQQSYSQITKTDTTQNKTITLKEVVISVNKFEETKKTVAQQVQVINANDISNLQPQTTADLISKTGIQVQMSQLGGGSPTLRGFEASRILLVVDGVRMNNLIYRAGHLQDIVKTDINSVDRMEVLFGPASTIYGSDALGGVILLYTKNPLFATDEKNSNIKVNFLSRYGSVNNEITNHLDLNYGTKKFASLTSFSYSKFDDLKGGKNQNPFYNGSYGERPYYVERINGKDSLVKNSDRYLQVGSAYSQYDLMEKILYKQNENITHGLNIQYSNSTDIPRYDRLTDPKGSGLKSAEWYYGPQTRMLAAYDLNINNAESFFQNIHFGLNYQMLEESRHNRNFGNNFRYNRIENVGVIGANLDFHKLTENHFFNFGLDMQMNSLKSTANVENIVADTTGKLDTRYPDGKNNMNNFAIYFSHKWKLNEQLYLVDGIRAGYSILHSTLVDTALLFHLPYTDIEQKTPVYSGSIGLIHSPSDDLKLSLLISTGFRVPNVDDVSKIFGSAPGMVIVPNIDLKPERTINYEIGITKIINNRTRWENSIYYTDYKDIAVIDTFQFNGKDSLMYDGTMSRVYANQNKETAYIYGFSSDLISKLDDHFTMAIGINYTYGRIKTDSMDYPLDHIPPFMARTSLTYNNNKFSSNLFINFNGSKMLKNYNLNGEDNEQYATSMGMPAWFTINLHTSYKVHKLFTLQAGVDNIFDTQYRTFASGINAPGRNFFATLKIHF
jgi:hemoglobin/transferrin/lactoferrin receptor protein